MFKSLRNAFISGLLLLAPVGVTVFVVNILISKVGNPTRDFFFFFIEPASLDNAWVSLMLDIASTVIVLSVITLLGWFSKLLIGRTVLMAFERLVTGVPLIRNVYSTVKQIIDTFAQQKKAVFQECVLVEYPRKGVWVLGFLTSESRGEVQEVTAADLVNVFVPTTPNPTSGFLLMVPNEEIIRLKMSIPDGMKLIISGGAVVPRYGEILPDNKTAPATTPSLERPQTELQNG